jgi:bacterial/archaeal transporter family-2 protein
MQSVFYVLAFIGGLLLTIQVGANSTLRHTIGSASAAALTNFTVGLLGLALLVLVTRQNWPSRESLAAAPPWAWCGGLLGAYYVATATLVGPRLGAATLLALSVLGQLIASLLVDHYGWIGFPQHPISVTRLAGAAMLFAGVLLITR